MFKWNPALKYLFGKRLLTLSSPKSQGRLFAHKVLEKDFQMSHKAVYF